MLALYYFGELFRRAMARARKEPIEEVALGFGDVNLSESSIDAGLAKNHRQSSSPPSYSVGCLAGLYILFLIIRKNTLHLPRSHTHPPIDLRQ